MMSTAVFLRNPRKWSCYDINAHQSMVRRTQRVLAGCACDECDAITGRRARRRRRAIRSACGREKARRTRERRGGEWRAVCARCACDACGRIGERVGVRAGGAQLRTQRWRTALVSRRQAGEAYVVGRPRPSAGRARCALRRIGARIVAHCACNWRRRCICTREPSGTCGANAATRARRNQAARACTAA